MSRRHASIGFSRRPGRVAETSPGQDPFTLVPPAMRAAWWRADMGITLTTGVVSGWADAWFGETLTQATEARRPSVEAAGIGGRPTILFDGTADSLVVDLASPCLAGTRPWMWTIFQFVTTSGAVVTIATLVDTGQGVTSRIIQQSTGTVFRTFRMETTGVSESVNGSAIDTAVHRIESCFSANVPPATVGVAALVVDASSVNSVISGTPSVNIGHVRLAAGGAGGDQYANVRIAEHMILRDEPSASLKSALRDYATRHYAGAV